MAALAGKGGLVKVGANTVAHINDWELSPSSNIMDITSFGDTWKNKLAGLFDSTTKCSGFYDMSDTNGQKALWDAFTGGTTVSVVLYTDTTGNIAVTSLVKSVPIKAAVDSTVEVEFDFEGVAAPVLTANS